MTTHQEPKGVGRGELREALEEAERQLRARLSDERWLRVGLTDGATCSQRTVDAVLGPIRRALESQGDATESEP